MSDDVQTEPKVQPIQRAQGSVIVLNSVASAELMDLAILNATQALGATTHVCSGLAELPALLARLNGVMRLAIISAPLPELIQAAQLVHAAAPLAEIVFPFAESEKNQLQSRLNAVPFIGSHWRCLDPLAAAFERKLQAAYRTAEQRRTVRTTLDRFNARMSTEQVAVDTLQLRKLVISDRFLASVLEHSTDAVISVDTEGRIVAFNPAAVKLFGLTQADAQSHPLTSLIGGTWPDHVSQLLASHEPSPLVHLVLPHADGDRHVEISANAIRDENNIHIAHTLMLRDITQRMQTEDALRKAEALAAAGRLAATVSHEINNPLEAVTNLLYLAGTEVLSENGREYLRLANVELERVSHVVKQTLGFFRNKDRSQDEAFDPTEAIAHILRIYTTKLSKKRIQTNTSFTDGVRLSMRKGEFEQIVSNLISNAVDACPQSGLLEIRSSSDSVRYQLEVQDSGAGVPQEILNRIFTPFFTTKQDVGTGLGLWVTKDLVEKYGGTISVTNSNPGAIFQIHLPLVV